MLGWFVRLLLLAAGVIAGWFVPEGDLGYMLIQFVVVLIFILIFSVGTLYFLRWRDRNRPPPE